jgi:endonuclease/exonuclease/phosphatase (EEP) superfamily protein YafD
MAAIARPILTMATWLGLAALVLGFAAPLHPLFDSIGHFRLHIAAGLVLMSAILVLSGCRRSAMLATGAALAAGLSTGVVVGVSRATTSVDLRLVQHNINFLNATLPAAADWIRGQRPDVVTLQEVTRTTSALAQMLAPDLPHQRICSFAGVGGVAILSRLAFVDSSCADGNGLVWARIVANGVPVTVASLHLHWPFPFNQAGQIVKLEADFQKMPKPVVLAGDFNAAPWSEAVGRISRGTGTTVVPGIRPTLRLSRIGWLPVGQLPIDHVLVPRGAARGTVVKGPTLGSDHHALLAEIGLR